MDLPEVTDEVLLKQIRKHYIQWEVYRKRKLKKAKCKICGKMFLKTEMISSPDTGGLAYWCINCAVDFDV